MKKFKKTKSSKGKMRGQYCIVRSLRKNEKVGDKINVNNDRILLRMNESKSNYKITGQISIYK